LSFLFEFRDDYTQSLYLTHAQARAARVKYGNTINRFQLLTGGRIWNKSHFQLNIPGTPRLKSPIVPLAAAHHNFPVSQLHETHKVAEWPRRSTYYVRAIPFCPD
jgi:hypothetical protein